MIKFAIATERTLAMVLLKQKQKRTSLANFFQKSPHRTDGDFFIQ